MPLKALVAMSGGVDSTVAACLLQDAGYETTGITMRLCEPVLPGGPDDPEGDLPQGIRDARAVSAQLGMNHIVCDLREEFRQDVIDRFVGAYEQGQTPNPCVICNRLLKFGRLCPYARQNGYDRLATGHFARIERDEGAGRWLLRKARDLSKDQSYFLYSLTQDQLAQVLFPLGGYTKAEVRKIASDRGLVTAGSKESQDICFIPGGDYSGFICGYTGRDYPPGDFVDSQGHVLGRHRGIIRYTIGQRKGLGLALARPQYVTALDLPGNRVILGDNETLFTRDFEAADFCWIASAPPSGDLRAAARIRYRHRETPATIHPLSSSRVRISFDDPQRAITPGQSVVLYDGDYVIGGGRIL